MSEPIGTDERLDRIEDLTAERDALREAVDEVTEYAKRHEAERDALAEKLAKAVEALRQIADPISLAQGNVNSEIAHATLAELETPHD